MKKFFFLLIFLPSCQKEYCWDCELITGHQHLPYQTRVYTTTQNEYCDKTAEEINQIIADHEYTMGMSSYSHMTCTKR